MASQTQSDLSPREVYRTLVRHKRKVLLFAGSVLAIGLIVTFFGPETYQSESKLIIRLGRENVALDPVATTGQVVQLSESRESEINSELELLKSRVLLETVVDQLGPQTVLGSRLSLLDMFAGVFSGDDPPAGSEAAKLADAKLRDKAIRFLAGSVKASVARKSNVVNIQCEAESPKLAQEIVSRLVSAYLDQHSDAHRTNGSQLFFADQTEKCRTVLDTTSVQLRDLKNKIGLSTLAEQHQLISKRIGLLQEQLSTTLSDAAAAETAVAEMRAKHAELPATLVTEHQDGHANQAADLMRSQLYALQLKEQELLSIYQDDFPLILEIKRQISSAEEILDRQVSKKALITEGLNQSREHLHLAALTEEAKACSLRTKGETLRKHLDEALTELRQLNDEEIKVAQMERELLLAETNFKKYSEHLEQARIDQELYTQRISNINVVQPATYVLKPIRPKKLINLALALAIAVVGGVWLALAAERMDRSLKSPQDVAAHLELPVLVSIPRFKGQHQNGFTKARVGDLVSS